MMLLPNLLLLSSPFAATVLVTILFKKQEIFRTLHSVLSDFLHNILLLIYPIKDAKNRSKCLPAVPFEWPGGNGDAAKFFNGPANSVKWSRLYGPIYRIWSGTHTEIVISRAEDIKTTFADSDRHLKAKNNDSGWLMGEVLGQCVGLLSQAEWSFLRARVEVPFLHKNVLNFIPEVQAQTESFFNDLFKQKTMTSRNTASKIGPLISIDAAQDTKMLPFRLVAALLYGNNLTADLLCPLESLIPDRERLFQYVMKGGVGRFWWSAYLPTEANRLLKRFQTAWLKFNKQAYDAAKERAIDAPIVLLWEQMEAGEIDRKQLLQTLDEILFANLDVTTGALSWLIVNIASHSSAQSTLYDELRTLNSDVHDTDAIKTYINSTNTYLAHCISESARVRPIAAFSVPQATPTPRVIGDYLIPARTSITVDSYSLNIRNAFWGEDGHTFRPERWRDLKPSETRYQAWRFGFGPRQCMGRHLAEKMLRCALVVLLRDYKLSVENKGDGTTAEDVFEVNPDSWITHPDVKILCRPRV